MSGVSGGGAHCPATIKRQCPEASVAFIDSQTPQMKVVKWIGRATPASKRPYTR